jgi:hypothetical protein
MSMTLEIPRPLDEELTWDAEREGVSASELATLLLYLTHAILNEDRPTPFREAVAMFLSHQSLDSHHVASVLEDLVRLCLKQPDEGDPSSEEEIRHGKGIGDIVALLKLWRNARVHLDVKSESILVSGQPEADLCGAEQFQQQTTETADEADQSRARHVRNIRGKYASVGVSSADLRRDRQADDATSDRQMRGLRT